MKNMVILLNFKNKFIIHHLIFILDRLIRRTKTLSSTLIHQAATAECECRRARGCSSCSLQAAAAIRMPVRLEN